MNQPPPLRKGVGFIFAAAGVLHAGGAGLAAYFSRALPLAQRISVLAAFYYAHFLLMICGACAYLFFGYWRMNVFYAEPFLDFLTGLGGFILITAVAGALAAHGHLGAVLFSAPGAFLILYGIGLIMGRAFGFGPRPKP